ncbi:hypothetical protein BsWGS_05683 [Bradybaena similaris]
MVQGSSISNTQMQGQDKDSKFISNQFHDSFTELNVGLGNKATQGSGWANMDSTQELKYSRCCNISYSIADCTGCRLGYVPDDLPRNISHLLLADNNLNNDALRDDVFANYSQLVALQLDSNNITVLPDNVFRGLLNLKSLSLYNNSIILDWTFRRSIVFKPLNNTLETLIMNRNTNDTNEAVQRIYPDLALSVLKRLSRLHIDGLRNASFRSGFQKLTNLTVLSMAGYKDGYCNLTSISSATFMNVKNLTFLNISDCNLNGSQIDQDAFSPLGRLQVLDVSNNYDLGIQAVGDFMHGLRNNVHLTRLKMQRVVNRFTPCIVVYKHTLRYFKSTRLRVIEAMDNEIEMIEEGALDFLPSSLKVVNLTNNRIMFGAYWKDMMSLTSLEKLYLDGYITPVKFPLFYPSQNSLCSYHPKITNYDTSQDSQELDKKCDCGATEYLQDEEAFILPLPPKLRNLTMHSNSLAYKVINLSFCPNNSLSSVDLSGNMFPLLEGPVTGLQNVKYLNLSSCFIQTIKELFFDSFNSLEYLNLFENLLGDCLDKDLNGSIFDNLNHLKYLNLSFNNIYRLHWKIFKDLEDIEILDLSTNRISHIAFKVDHMKNLTFLDLRKNDITSLDQGLRDLVDSLLSANQSVSIDMRENPIYCDCYNLDFIEWVVRTNVFGDNYTLYYCKYPIENQTAVPMPYGYGDEVAKLRRQCSTHVGLLLAVIGATLLVMAAIIGILLYRFRWTLRYWYHAAKMKIYTAHKISEEFEYDVFVSYASDDVDFVLQELSPELSGQRRLKLLVHGENFQTGRHIADNIYMAVRQSRKTLVILTTNMLRSHWCNYELQMARLESINTGRDVLVILFLEEIPPNTMSVNMLSYIKTSTYISYPQEAQHRDAFWNKLAADLRAA